MDDNIIQLIERARGQKMSDSEREEQRRSFAYGNSRIENQRITRSSIDEEALKLAGENGQKH